MQNKTYLWPTLALACLLASCSSNDTENTNPSDMMMGGCVPSAEVCDGMDNDCDPMTPDGADELTLGNDCDGADTDLCEEGKIECVMGALTCSDATDDDLDVCDGMDNDCNPMTADGADEATLGDECDGMDSDLCAEGQVECAMGALSCSDNTEDDLDVCDGMDNDCDPASDDGSEAPCPMGQFCDAGMCISAAPIKVAAGAKHTCALMASGGIKCWGDNQYGQLGNGTTDSSTVPVAVSGISNAVDFAFGTNFGCAVLDTGDVKCWGRNSFGQLGDGSKIDSQTPVSVIMVSDAVEVDTGSSHACARLTSGSMKCWGLNNAGRLGNNSQTQTSTPVDVRNVTDAIDIGLGSDHSCAIVSNGDLYCWGSNSRYQLGMTTPQVRAPRLVENISGVSSIVPGYNHTCALLTSGEVQCWGWNFFQQLGSVTMDDRVANPVTVPNLTNVTALAAGQSSSTCALEMSGEITCWGVNYDGELGDGNPVRSSPPVSVEGINNATSIGMGQSHSCAILDSGELKCWGNNESGQLGDGTTMNQLVPVTVIGL